MPHYFERFYSSTSLLFLDFWCRRMIKLINKAFIYYTSFPLLYLLQIQECLITRLLFDLRDHKQQFWNIFFYPSFLCVSLILSFDHYCTLREYFFVHYLSSFFFLSLLILAFSRRFGRCHTSSWQRFLKPSFPSVSLLSPPLDRHPLVALTWPIWIQWTKLFLWRNLNSDPGKSNGPAIWEKNYSTAVGENTKHLYQLKERGCSPPFWLGPFPDVLPASFWSVRWQ